MLGPLPLFKIDQNKLYNSYKHL